MNNAAQNASRSRPLRLLSAAVVSSIAAVFALAACGSQATPTPEADVENPPAHTPAAAPHAKAIASPRTPSDASLRFGTRDVPEKQAGTIRLVAYNILNLFDDRDNPALSERNEDIDDYKPELEQAEVAAAILAIDADVIALQEIESIEALTEFRERYLPGAGYDYVMSIDVGQERGIEQSVLSRFPIVEASVMPNLDLGGVHPEKWGSSPNRNAGEPLTYRRAPLKVRVQVPAGERDNAQPYELTLFVVHHKSGGPANYWREAEAKAIVSQINALKATSPQQRVAVLGDFNAKPDAESIIMYSRDAHLNDIFAGYEAGDPVAVTHNSGRRIDYIFVNDALGADLVEGSEFVYATAMREQGYNWREAHDTPGYASDHLPVSVDIRVAGQN